jgi:hypothetical protein
MVISPTSVAKLVDGVVLIQLLESAFYWGQVNMLIGGIGMFDPRRI